MFHKEEGSLPKLPPEGWGSTTQRVLEVVSFAFDVVNGHSWSLRVQSRITAECGRLRQRKFRQVPHREFAGSNVEGLREQGRRFAGRNVEDTNQSPVKPPLSKGQRACITCGILHKKSRSKVSSDRDFDSEFPLRLSSVIYGKITNHRCGVAVPRRL